MTITTPNRNPQTPAPDDWGTIGEQVDVLTRSPDAEFILEDDEPALEWREAVLPLSMFGDAILAVLSDTSSVGLPPTVSGYDHDYEVARMARIRGWMLLRGGAATALAESPVLVVIKNNVPTILDGWHRLRVALLDYQTTSFHAVFCAQWDMTEGKGPIQPHRAHSESGPSFRAR